MRGLPWWKFLHPWVKAYKGAPPKVIVFPTLIMIATGFISVLLVGLYRSSLIEQQRHEVQTKTEEIASILTSRINSHFAILNGLAGMIKIHLAEGLSEEHFTTYAQSIRANDPIIQLIAFFPENGQTYFYPLTGNEGIAQTSLGDLMETREASLAADIERAILSREITLSDPYKMIGGKVGITARLAVFDRNELLGLTEIILDQSSLFDIPDFSPFEAGIHYSIRDRKGFTFFGDDRTFSADPETASIILPEGIWTIAAIPEDGWENGIGQNLIFAWLIAGLVTWGSGHLSFFIFNNQILLKKAVEERTSALIESETRYSQTFAAIQDGIWDWDIRKGSGFASENCYSILGIEEDNFSGIRKWIQYFHPDDRGTAELQLESSIKAGSGFNIQARLLPVNEQPVYILIRGRVANHDGGGNAVRYLGTLSDISEEKKSEDILRESEARFRAVFNNNHAVMLLIDADTSRIIDANPAACHFYGWTYKEFISKEAFDLSLQNKGELKKALEKEVSGDQPAVITQHRLANGQVRDVEIFTGPIVQNGKIILFCIIQDISGRRQAEKSLLQSENRLRFALEGANDGLWDLNIQTGELYISPRAAEILENSPGDLLDILLNRNDFINRGDRKMVNAKRSEHFDGMTDVFEIDQRLKTKSGRWKWVQIRGKLFERDSNNKPLRMTGTVTDISHRKLAEDTMQAAQGELKRLLEEADTSRQVLLSMLEDQKAAEEKLGQINASLEQRVKERTIQLETANNELEAFSYSVSHDLRAPLRGIDGWSHALLEDYNDCLDEKGQTYLNRVRSETQHMGDLIDNLLRLSRVSRMELNWVEVDLSDQARKICDRLSEEYLKNPPIFIIQSDLKAVGDIHLLEIVLTNLLTNACKFSSKQSTPRIEFGQAIVSGIKEFYVRDNGVGFEIKNAGKLFGAFQRMHRQTEFPGTGIGLATVKRIVNKHGGKVWADAQKGKGATFYFTLPERK